MTHTEHPRPAPPVSEEQRYTKTTVMAGVPYTENPYADLSRVTPDGPYPAPRRRVRWDRLNIAAVAFALGMAVHTGLASATRPTRIPAPPPAVTFTPAPLVAPGPLKIGSDLYLWTASRGDGSIEFQWPQSQEDLEALFKQLEEIAWQNGNAAPREPVAIPAREGVGE